MTKYLASRCSLPWRQAICAIVFGIAVPLVRASTMPPASRFSFSSRTTSPSLRPLRSSICRNRLGSNWPSGPWNALLAAIRSAIIASEIASPRLDAWASSEAPCRSCARTCRSSPMDFACSAVICTPWRSLNALIWRSSARRYSWPVIFSLPTRASTSVVWPRNTSAMPQIPKLIARRAIKIFAIQLPAEERRASIMGRGFPQNLPLARKFFPSAVHIRYADAVRKSMRARFQLGKAVLGEAK